MLKLGAKYKDKVTGFTGLAIGRASYITGCDQYLLVPPIDKDGKKREGEWFDEQRIEQVGKKVMSMDNSNGTGADQAAPYK